MRAGDIVFLKPVGLIGRIVAWVDGGPYSHVAIAVSETHIIEAQYFTRSRIWPVYQGQNVMVLDVGLTDEQRHDLVHHAIALTGRWYDYKQIAYYFFRNVFRLNFKAIWNSQNNLICSELVALLLLAVGYAGATTLNLNVTPRELYEHIIAHQMEAII